MPTFEAMRRKGLRECEPITRYKLCQRELNLQNVLKPLLYIPRVCALHEQRAHLL